MLGLIEDAFDSVVDTADNFISDPIGSVVDTVTQPLVDAADIIDGLSEGELRTEAITRVGIDVASGMVLSELISLHNNR